MNNVKVGSYTGTGAAINIELGFIPDYVRIWNVTDGDVCFEWFYGMGAADVLKTQDIVDNATTGNHALSLVTSAGVDAYNPADYASELGFTVGTALSESGKTFYYVALRNSQ